MKKSLAALVISSVLLAGCNNLAPSVVLDASIQQLQGEGMFSPVKGIDVANNQFISDDFYKVQGVITAVQTKALGKDLKVGFFMQAPSDNNPKTSDGIFVETSSFSHLKVGDLVEVVARVEEDYHWTKLTSISNIKVLKNNQPLPAPAVIKIGDNFFESLEQYEGMRVKIEKESDIHVTRNFGFDYGPFRNNLYLSHKNAILHPNQLQAPRPYDPKQEKLFVVESFQHPGNGNVPWYPDFGKPDLNGSSDNYIRINDLVDGLEGVMGYSYGLYRLYVTNTANENTFIHVNPRLETPDLKKGGNLRIASFNVLNYFNPPYDQPSRNPLRQNRGAKTEAEFNLQSEKIAKAIVNMNADIVGLMEIENNGFDEKSAVMDLVTKINALIKDPKDHYHFFTPNKGEKHIGTDAITTQVLYKKSKVTMTDYQIIRMPEQHSPAQGYKLGNQTKLAYGNTYQRDTLAPTFKINGTDKTLTIAVNHFKSKGGACYEDVVDGKLDDTNMQGACEGLRVAAAEHLGETLAKVKGAKILLGDFNSYANEDPIMVLTNRDNAPKDYKIKAAGYTFLGGSTQDHKLYGKEGKVIDKTYGYVNIVRKLHPEAYS